MASSSRPKALELVLQVRALKGPKRNLRVNFSGGGQRRWLRMEALMRVGTSAQVQSNASATACLEAVKAA